VQQAAQEDGVPGSRPSNLGSILARLAYAAGSLFARPLLTVVARPFAAVAQMNFFNSRFKHKNIIPIFIL